MNHSVPAPYYDDLAAALGFAFGHMTAAVTNRRSAFHTPTLATVARDGAPSCRTVVLREFDGAARILRFHTDMRGRKWEELQREPRVAIHGYDAGLKLQLRFRGRAELHTEDEVARAAWDASRTMSRACYAQRAAPGSSVDDPYAALADAEDAETAYARFAVVRVHFDVMEWLYLAALGHRRAEFAWRGEAMTARWLAP
jgi:pyridoxine/pyridoxamine 5'-phosphate oxidase